MLLIETIYFYNINHFNLFVHTILYIFFKEAMTISHLIEHLRTLINLVVAKKYLKASNFESRLVLLFWWKQSFHFYPSSFSCSGPFLPLPLLIFAWHVGGRYGDGERRKRKKGKKSKEIILSATDSRWRFNNKQIGEKMCQFPLNNNSHFETLNPSQRNIVRWRNYRRKQVQSAKKTVFWLFVLLSK